MAWKTAVLARTGAEILLVRIGPGILNVWAILLIAGELSLAGYGAFSTVIATAGMVSNLAFGPLTFSVVPRMAEVVRDGRGAEFQGTLLSCGLVASAAVLLLGSLFSGVMSEAIWAGGIVAASGLFALFQSVLRGQLLFWRYGLAAAAQGAALLGAAWLVLPDDPRAEVALAVFLASQVLGAFMSYLMAGAPSPRRPKRALLSETLAVGVPFTFSNLAENTLLLGFRYTILWLGTPAMLGAFSFAVDLAQRLAGTIINVASFAMVPRAYRVLAAGDTTSFRKILVRSAATAGVLAVLIVCGVIAIAELDVFRALRSETFVLTAFVLASLAVVINRLKKLVVDPFAVHARSPGCIPRGYYIAGPLAVSGAGAALLLALPDLVLVLYAAGYVGAAAVTMMCVRRAARGAGPTL